ncbi:hypothetical protein [Flavobacterium sp. GCM10027622]|uniref:hypothetical protein n=1 Tax=unclassified Flavobacterium TaxID=196869 RepID=UPI003613A203
MVFAYDIHIIEEYSEAIVKETKSETSYPTGFWMVDTFVKFFIKRTNKKVIRKLDQLRMAVDSFSSIVDNMSIDQAEKALKEVKEFTKKIITSSEEYKKLNFPEDSRLEDAFKNTLHVMFRYENLLHKRIYKDSPIIKTPENLRNGVMKMNSNNIDRLLK